MGKNHSSWSTGIGGLDDALKGLRGGDNVVWQVQDIEQYRSFVAPAVQEALHRQREVIYFRFASHRRLPATGDGVDVVELLPEAGFEPFISRIHQRIEEAGPGVLYVFDCLSELAADWYSDQMLANFFTLTCPYLYDLETVAYFALFRGLHSSRAIGPVSETTQLLLDVYSHNRKIYVHPVKVQNRHSATIHMLHAWENGDRFAPVTLSATVADVLRTAGGSGFDSRISLSLWERTSLEARELLERERSAAGDTAAGRRLLDRMLRMMVSRDDTMLRLCRRYLALADVLQIGERMIGTGLVGGKAVGMLLAGAILRREGERWRSLLETHDSFFIGSDVFYTYLVRNGLWWIRERQRGSGRVLAEAEQVRQRILCGEFPDYILGRLGEMLDYFGQAPFIVRSSSLLEDGFGNAFSGKYDSVFCVNQGPRPRRMAELLTAVRTIYAGTMSEKALRYREMRNLLDRDEQMALLIMRVSGDCHGRRFMPAIAGVGFSYNPYAWSEYIDPRAGVLRLVFGLGTRAVDRCDDDYTRVVALNAPQRRPESNFEEVAAYAQRRVDFLDLESNRPVSDRFDRVAADIDASLLQKVAEPATAADGRRQSLLPAFRALLLETGFVKDMRDLLGLLQRGYNNPVDIEFTLNFSADGGYRINVVQCRPLQVRGAEVPSLPEPSVKEDCLLLESYGAVIGHSRLLRVDRLIYIPATAYSKLSLRDRAQVARVIGRLNLAHGEGGNLMLIGPGRWGTGSPELGVPVRFADIDRGAVLCEIVDMGGGLVPDVSLGTHFLNDLIEAEMLYLALFPGRNRNRLQDRVLLRAPNRLEQLAPRDESWREAVRVIDAGDIGGCTLYADALKQRVVVYRE